MPHPLTFGSVCSGIEAASVAWLPLGWRCAFMSETEAFPRAVLKDRYPETPLYGDFTRLRDHVADIADIDILVGGCPCQAFSIAGLRNSLDDDRGNLTLEFVRLANAIDDFRHTRTGGGGKGISILYENVPGILNTKDNAFGCFLAALVGADTALKPGKRRSWTNAGLVVGPRRAAAWRTLDAQYFGLAQRRERMFVVACPRGGGDPSEILFEPEGVRRYSPPSREAGASVTGTVAAGSHGRGWRLGADEAAAGHCVAVAGTLKGNGGGADDNDARNGRLVHEVITLTPGDRGLSVDQACGGMAIPVNAYRTSGNCGAWSTGDCVDTLTSGTDRSSHVLAFGGNNTSGPIDVATARNACHSASGRMDFETETFIACATGDIAHTLRADGFDASEDGTGRCHPIINQGVASVRRLTVIETARLQGFPDNHARITWRGKPVEDCPDGPQYKAFGNSMAVPVMSWLGRRIERSLSTVLP